VTNANNNYYRLLFRVTLAVVMCCHC